MAEIKANRLSILADGKSIEIKNPSKLNLELNKALLDPQQFQSFTADPKGFAERFDLKIDPEVSSALSAKLSGIKSLDDLQRVTRGEGDGGATVWAVAGGSFSVASSKIAVAF